MTRFQADLFVGGMTLKHLEAFIEDERVADPPHWVGFLRLERAQEHLLDLRRPYLLVLDDGRMRRMQITEIRSGPDATSIDAQFEACD